MPILSSHTNEADVEQMLAFYKQNFTTVDLVTCDNCNSFLAFELTGPNGMGMAPNEVGKYIVPIGNKLESHRVRLDEAPTGERMVGYQCACGNDTRVASIEEGVVPIGRPGIGLSPFEKHQIREALKSDKKYKPDFKQLGNKKHFESFTVERVQ